MPFSKARLAALVLSLALVACAEKKTVEDSAPPVVAAPPAAAALPPVPTPPAPPMPPAGHGLHCDKMLVRQDGKDIKPVNGTFTLARRNFALVYTGAEPQPSLYLSTVGLLNEGLSRLGQREIWASADEYIAHEPDDLPIRDGARLIADPDAQDQFLAGMGEGYPDFFRQMVIVNDEAGVILSALKAGAGFVPQGNVQVQTVRALGGLAVVKTRFKLLNLTYFGTLERRGPGGKGSFGSRSLLRLAWGSCRLAFQ